MITSDAARRLAIARMVALDQGDEIRDGRGQYRRPVQSALVVKIRRAVKRSKGAVMVDARSGPATTSWCQGRSDDLVTEPSRGFHFASDIVRTPPTGGVKRRIRRRSAWRREADMGPDSSEAVVTLSAMAA